MSRKHIKDIMFDFMQNFPFVPGKQEMLSRVSLLICYLVFHYLNVLTS